MTAGLQVWNDSSYLQVDGYNQHMVLLRKGQVTTTALTNGRTDMPCSMCTIAVNPGEILAIPDATFNVAGKYQGSWQIHTLNGPGTTFDFFIFGPYQPSGINVGLEIYDESQRLIYDSGRLPMRVLGNVAGLGDFTVGVPGRRYALYPNMLSCHLTRTSQGYTPGSNLQALLIANFTSGFGRVSGQTVHIETTYYMATVAGPVSSSQVPQNWNIDFDNNIQNQFTVLDITGY